MPSMVGVPAHYESFDGLWTCLVAPEAVQKVSFSHSIHQHTAANACDQLSAICREAQGLHE